MDNLPKFCAVQYVMFDIVCVSIVVFKMIHFTHFALLCCLVVNS